MKLEERYKLGLVQTEMIFPPSSGAQVPAAHKANRDAGEFADGSTSPPRKYPVSIQRLLRRRGK